MHILTKVFVLVASLLSVLMAALTITYSVSADRITRDYDVLESRVTAAQNALTAQADQHGRAIDDLRGEASNLRNELASRDATIREIQAERNALIIDLRRAQEEAASATGQLAQFGVTTETQTRLIESYKDEVALLRDNELRNREQKLDLEDKLADLQSQVQVFQQSQRALQEQLVEAQNELTRARGGVVSDTSRSGIPFEASGPTVRGEVEQVRTDPRTGDVIVHVNLGSNDRMAENVKLYVDRNGREYIGELVLDTVDLNHAIGRMTFVKSGARVREGDRVSSKLGS